MKIQSTTNYLNTSLNHNRNKIHAFQQTPVQQQNYKPSFSGAMPVNIHSNKFFAAQTYLNTAKEALSKVQNLDLYNFDLNKLNGIQEGIKVFDGLNMKEIAFVANSVAEIAVNRGCRNICVHCYANAKAPINETSNQINKMSWNDFSALTDGFEELNKRMGFSVFNRKNNKHPMVIPFHDADCSEVLLKDNNGTEHDFIDIAERLKKVFNLPVYFDTSGWNIKDAKAQKRMEKYVEYYSKPENFNKLEQINLSINPFHSMYAKSLELKQNNKPELAAKIYDLYTTRMANVLYTMTPLQKNPNFNFIARATANNSKVPEGFKEKDLRLMFMDILDKLNDLYKADLNGNQKLVKNEDEMFEFFDNFYHELNEISTSISIAERSSKIVSPNDKMVMESKMRQEQSINDVMSIKSIRDFRKVNKDMDRHFHGIIDANGNYYLTTYHVSFPTEIKLNFENKDKKTAPIAPLLQQDLPFRKSVINNV